jgi:hypothetical protein
MFPGYLAELGEGKTNVVKANCSKNTTEKIERRFFSLYSWFLKLSLGEQIVTEKV